MEHEPLVCRFDDLDPAFVGDHGTGVDGWPMPSVYRLGLPGKTESIFLKFCVIRGCERGARSLLLTSRHIFGPAKNEHVLLPAHHFNDSEEAGSMIPKRLFRRWFQRLAFTSRTAARRRPR